MMRLIFTILILAIFSHSAYAKLYGQRYCHEENFSCKRIKAGMSWSSLFPDPVERDIVMRINRMNTQLYPGLLIAIPDHLETANIMDFSPFPMQIEAGMEKKVIVDPTRDAWAAYDTSGQLIRWGPISGGADWCNDVDEPCQTHAGAFRVFSLGSSDCISSKFPLPDGGAPMPYCMYFNGGQALHGEPNGLPGFHASHGCVRLFVNDAKWLRYDFVEGPNANNNFRGTKIIVKEYEGEDPALADDPSTDKPVSTVKKRQRDQDEEQDASDNKGSDEQQYHGYQYEEEENHAGSVERDEPRHADEADSAGDDAMQFHMSVRDRMEVVEPSPRDEF